LGEKPKLTRFAPQDAEGMDCDWGSVRCGVPLNRPLSFQFDRWLLPSTATRQSIQLSVAEATSAEFMQPTYELLTRTVTYSDAAGLEQGLVYVLALADSETQTSGWGFASYDARSLDRKTVPDSIVFRTAEADPVYDPTPSPPRLCRDALAAFSKAGCTAAHCHRTSDTELPCANLRLDQKSGLTTAIRRVAIATDRAGNSGTMSELPARFGMNMPVIEPGEPAMSFLLYRMLFGRDAYRNASGQFEVAPPSTKELSFATTWFGATGPMPPPSVGFPKDVSPVELTRVIETWIRDGADTDACEP
jgi:hypothetical protein